MRYELKNFVRFLLFCFALLIFVNSAKLIASDTLYGQWNQHCYIVVSDVNGFDWEESNMISAQMGGYLVTINSKDENDYLFNLIKNNLNYWKKTNSDFLGPWIGGFQESGAVEPDKSWAWITGEDFDFTNWASGEPDEFNNNNENRICFFGRGEPQDFWNDYPDSEKLFSFIVEINDILKIDAGNDKIIDIGDTIQIGGNPTAEGNNKPFEYFWRPTINIDNANSTNPKVFPKHTTMYYLTVIPAKGCPIYDSVLVKVNSPEISVSKPDFKPLICGKQTETTFEIKNIGTKKLEIKKIIINDVKNQFALKQAFQIFSLDPDQSKNIKLVFKAKELGNSYAEMIIQSNANPDSLLIITLRARKDSIDLIPENDFIDLGVICLNTSKDTIFTISNKGTITTGGFIRTSKTLEITDNQFLLQPDEKKVFNLHYAGSSQAIDINTQIKIIDSACNIIKNIDVRIKIAEPKIYADKLYIVSTVGNPKESSLKIHNISDVDVFLNQPVINDSRFQIINTQFPLKIPRNGFNTINLRYRPTDTNFIELDIELSGYPCGVSATAQLFGNAADVSATLKIPDISAKSGQIIDIPIYLIDTVNYYNSGYKGFDAELKFNSTLLVPYENTPKGRIENGYRIIPLHLPFLPLKDSILSKLKFLVTLGNKEHSVISLTNYNTIPDDNGVFLQAVSGDFTLLDICKEGGERLFEDTGVLMLSQNYPNPADDITSIEINIIETGRTSLEIYNFLGERIFTVFNSVLKIGDYKFAINTAQMKSGVYFYILKTLTQIETRTMRVVH